MENLSPQDKRDLKNLDALFYQSRSFSKEDLETEDDFDEQDKIQNRKDYVVDPFV